LGAILSGRGDEFANRLGKLSLALFKKFGTKEVASRIYTYVYGLIHHNFAPVHETFTPLSDAMKISRDIGYRYGVLQNASLYCSHAFLGGMNLVQMLKDIEKIKTFIPFITADLVGMNKALLNLTKQDTNNPFEISHNKIHDFRSLKSQDLLNLIDKNTANSSNISDSEADKFGSVDNREISDFSSKIFSVVACMMSYLFHKYSLALEELERIDSMSSNCPLLISLFVHPHYIFYNGLVRLALARCEKGKIKYIIHAKEYISKLRKWSENSPQNYLNKIHLLEGEYHALYGNNVKAGEHYEEAIFLSKKNGFLHEEGMACERAGMFYLQFSQDTTALEVLLRSYNCFKCWGAEAKMKQLIDLHPFLSNEVCSKNLTKNLKRKKRDRLDAKK